MHDIAACAANGWRAASVAGFVGGCALLLAPQVDILKDLLARGVDELDELHADRITFGVLLLAPVNDAPFDERRTREVAESGP